ncbi:uncharacterized protein DS421_12g381170 [Arachis hypogaea]|nr:uncharacterized protein DS421_12g381170 [Arachis hypogaea]
MVSFGCSSAGLVLQQELAMFSNIFKGSQQLLPSVAWKPEIVRYQYLCLSPILAQRPMLVDSLATFPNTIIFSFDIDECQQLFTTLSYQIGYTLKPLLDIFQDPALSSKIQVHPDGQVTFLGSAIEMKDFLSLVAELIMNMFEAETRSHSSTMEIHSTITVPLRSPERVKAKRMKKKNTKTAPENSDSLAKEILPELPHLLTQFFVGIVGTDLAVMLSVVCKLACGRVPFCTSKLLNTGFRFGLVWLSWAVSKLRDTIINISKHAGKLGLQSSSSGVASSGCTEACLSTTSNCVVAKKFEETLNFLDVYGLWLLVK